MFIYIFQTFFDAVILESDKDKDNMIKDIEELLKEKSVLEKVSFLTIIMHIYSNNCYTFRNCKWILQSMNIMMQFH